MPIAVAIFMLFLWVGLGFSQPPSKAWEQYIKEANSYMQSGQYGKALVQLQKARALDSLQLKLDQKIRECQIRLGTWVPGQGAASLEWIEVDKLRLQEVPAKSYDSLLRVAKSLEERENYEVALKILAHIAEKAPNKKEYLKAHQDLRLKMDQLVVNHTEVGEVYLRQGRFGGAREEFRRALFFKPSDPYLLDRVKLIESKQAEMLSSYRSQLKMALEKKDVEASILVADRAFRDFPKELEFQRKSDSLRSLRELEMNKILTECRKSMASGQIGQAEARLREALVQFPGEPAVVQLQLEAQQLLERSKKNARKDSLEKQFAQAMESGNVGLGNMHLQRLKSEFPEEDYSKEQESLNQRKGQFQKQQDFENILESARLFMQDGLLTKAKETLQSALAMQPESPVARQMLEDLRKEESKQATVEGQRRKDVQKAEALVAAGQIQSAKKVDLSLSGVGKVDQEVKQVQRTIREAEFARTPEKDRNAQSLFLEGIAKYRTGDYEEALGKWQEVLKLNPEHDQAKKYLVNVKQKLSRMQ